jgi:hypothetical protein
MWYVLQAVVLQLSLITYRFNYLPKRAMILVNFPGPLHYLEREQTEPGTPIQSIKGKNSHCH